MEPKYTKGKWYMNTTKKFIDNKGLAITDEVGRLIAEVSHNMAELTLEEYYANAKLIAATPEMLEALKTAKEFIDYAAGAKLNLFSDKMQLMYQASANINAAIKKATE